MYKIAFFDVDGTLLKLGEKCMTKPTVETLKKLKQQGVLLCMATGRGVLTMPKFDEITFDVCMTFNGSYCFTKDKVIYQNPLDIEDIKKVLENTKKMGRALAISSDTLLVTNGTDPDLEMYFAFGDEKIVIAPNFDELCERNIYQLMASCRADEYDAILEGTKNIKVAAWWDKAADFIPSIGGKGVAVKKVLDYFGFAKEDAIAFGDGANDIDMFQAVGTGVAMGNASDEVKKFAHECCKSVDEDGIYAYFKENHEKFNYFYR